MSGVPDYPLEETIDFKFTSRAFATGIPTTLSGSPVVEIYEDNSVTQITAAETLTVDFDSVTGLNNLRVVATAANGFEAGKSYHCVISAGTVGGVSVVGEVVAQFSIQRSPVNWANVTAPTTAVDLSATDIQLVDTVTTYTGNTVQTGDTYALANGATGFAAIDTVVDAIKVKTDFLPSATAGAAGGVFIAGTNAATTITTSLTTTFTGNLTGSVASVSGAVGSVTGAVGSVTGSVGSLVGHTVQTGDTFALANGATGFAAIDTVVDAILVDTAEIGAAGVGLTDLGGMSTAMKAEVAAECATALLAYDAPTDTEMVAAFTEIKGATWAAGTDTLEHIRDKETDIETDTQDLQTQIGTAGAGLTDLGAMSTAMKAEMLAEVNAALDTAIVELGVGAPTATPTIRTALQLLYMALRNKTVVQTSGTDALEIYNNAGTIIAKKLLTDTGTDYTEAEMVSG